MECLIITCGSVRATECAISCAVLEHAHYSLVHAVLEQAHYSLVPYDGNSYIHLPFLSFTNNDEAEEMLEAS